MQNKVVSWSLPTWNHAGTPQDSKSTTESILPKCAAFFMSSASWIWSSPQLRFKKEMLRYDGSAKSRARISLNSQKSKINFTSFLFPKTVASGERSTTSSFALLPSWEFPGVDLYIIYQLAIITDGRDVAFLILIARYWKIQSAYVTPSLTRGYLYNKSIRLSWHIYKLK